MYNSELDIKPLPVLHNLLQQMHQHIHIVLVSAQLPSAAAGDPSSGVAVDCEYIGGCTVADAE